MTITGDMWLDIWIIGAAALMVAGLGYAGWLWQTDEHRFMEVSEESTVLILFLAIVLWPIVAGLALLSLPFWTGCAVGALHTRRTGDDTFHAAAREQQDQETTT